MPNKQWDDDQIESMLREFPTIKDERPKEEVFQRLNQKPSVKKKPKRWLPLLVAALAFITVGILVASIISQNGTDSAQYSGSSEESAKDEAATSDTSNLNEQSIPEAESSEGAKSIESFGVEESRLDTGIHAVYQDDLDGHMLFTIGLTENAFVIPVSFLIPEEQITRDFPERDPSSVDLYNRYANQLDEQALGFDEYHPYLGELTADGEAAVHKLPADHQYDLASASLQVYIKSLQETFKDRKEIRIVDEKGDAADFSQVGPMEPLKTMQEKLAYYSLRTDGGKVYAVPDYGMVYASAAEALEALKESPNDFLMSPIPEDVKYTVSEKEEIITVNFTETLKLEIFDEETVRQMIESLSLTAKPFGKAVQLTGTDQSEWQEFNLQEPLPVPVAPNNIPWPLK